MVAPPGAGKTTWVREHFPVDQRVSLDEYRWRLSGDAADQSATRTASAIMHLVVEERMSRGLTTVVDATNACAQDRADVVRHATAWERHSIAVVLHTPLEMCIARQAAREQPDLRWPHGRAVPADVIRAMHAAIVADLPALRVISEVHVLPDRTFRTGYVPAGVRDALPWLRSLPEEWPDWRRHGGQ